MRNVPRELGNFFQSVGRPPRRVAAVARAFCRTARRGLFDSWPYFARRFGVKIDLFLEPKPGIPPSPAHLAEVIARMKEENIRVIFVEPYLNRRSAETVARNTGATVLDVAHFPGGVKGTEGGYLQLFDRLVRSLAAAFGGGGLSVLGAGLYTLHRERASLRRVKVEAMAE